MIARPLKKKISKFKSEIINHKSKKIKKKKIRCNTRALVLGVFGSGTGRTGSRRKDRVKRRTGKVNYEGPINFKIYTNKRE